MKTQGENKTHKTHELRAAVVINIRKYDKIWKKIISICDLFKIFDVYFL